MQTLPHRTEAEDTANAILQARKEILAEYEEDILSYYVHLEITGPKLAYFWGYRSFERAFSIVKHTRIKEKRG